MKEVLFRSGLNSDQNESFFLNQICIKLLIILFPSDSVHRFEIIDETCNYYRDRLLRTTNYRVDVTVVAVVVAVFLHLITCIVCKVAKELWPSDCYYYTTAVQRYWPEMNKRIECKNYRYKLNSQSLFFFNEREDDLAACKLKELLYKLLKHLLLFH